MEVKTISPTEELLKKRDYCDFHDIYVDGELEVSARDLSYDCPEDATLGRDMNFVFSIVNLMKRAHEAGARGEEFSVEETTVSEY